MPPVSQRRAECTYSKSPHRRDRRRAEIRSPSVFRLGNREISREWRFHLGAKFLAQVEKAAAEGRHQPLVSAAGQRVYRSVSYVERDGADLLHGIDDQEDAAVAAQPRQRVEIAAKAVIPLHGADGDDASIASDRGFDVFAPAASFAVGKDVDRDAEVVSLLEPGQGDFQELQIAK